MDVVNFAEKLALGTVQFGLPYGISNKSGQILYPEVCEILRAATHANINTIDTATSYGNSETVVGKALKETNTNFQIITKISGNEVSIAETISQSLEKLGIESLYGCLHHSFPNYLEAPEHYESLLNLKATGKIFKTGFSVYYPEQIDYLLQNNIPFDLVQVPYNVFDQRFRKVFPKLKKAGVEIHVRSVFLQGLFFLNPETLNPFFKEIAPEIRAVQNLSRDKSIPLEAMLLSFAALNPEIDKIVIGVENAGQLAQNLTFINHLPAVEKITQNLTELAITQEDYILPFNWKL